MPTYNLRITRPAPSMWQDREVFQAESYAKAVEHARATWRRVRRPVCLGTGEYGMHAYHRIDAAGVATDVNTNSGIPALEVLA